MAGARFSVYREQYEGTPLWSEIQNVELDKDGKYNVLLGSNTRDGVPVELFTTPEPRWLEVEMDQIKQPRIQLGSVPYAVKAVDADTLGGIPAASFLRVHPSVIAGFGNSNGTRSPGALAADISPAANVGAPGCIGMFGNTTDLICSTIIQGVAQATNAISIGSPTTFFGAMTLVGNMPFGDASGLALYNAGGGANASVSIDMYNTFANGGIPQAKIKAIDDGGYSDHLTFWTKIPGAAGNPVTEKVRITSTGNVGIGITNLVGTQYGAKSLQIQAAGGSTVRLMDTSSGGTSGEVSYVDSLGLILATQTNRNILLLPGGTGNVGIGMTNPTNPLQLASGALVTPGGVFTNASDRNVKENFTPVSQDEMLEKIVELPITEWNYKNEDATVRHVGPVAQDFYSIFGLGNSSTSISTIDPSSIALVGIQALDAKSRHQNEQLAEVRAQLDAKTEEIRSLRERLAKLETLLERVTQGPAPR